MGTRRRQDEAVRHGELGLVGNARRLDGDLTRQVGEDTQRHDPAGLQGSFLAAQHEQALEDFVQAYCGHDQFAGGLDDWGKRSGVLSPGEILQPAG